MARQVLVLAFIFVAAIGAAMAREAPSESPKSSTAPSSSPKASPSGSPSHKSAPAASPKASPSPASSPASSPVATEEEDISSPPAPASEAIEFGAPVLAPAADNVFPADEAAPPTDEKNGASALKLSAAVVALAGFFAF